MMEFFGKPQDYFNRVKTADENPIVRQSQPFYDVLPVSGEVHPFHGLQ